jgi:hypothetical protein
MRNKNVSFHFICIPQSLPVCLSPPQLPNKQWSNSMSNSYGSLGFKPALSPLLRKAHQAHESGACEVGRRLRRTWATATCVCCCCCWRSCWRSCIWWCVDSGVPVPKPGSFEEEEGSSIRGEAVSMGSWGWGETWGDDRTWHKGRNYLKGSRFLCNIHDLLTGRVKWPLTTYELGMLCPEWNMKWGSREDMSLPEFGP